MHVKGVKKAEQVKHAHQAQLKESKFVTDIASHLTPYVFIIIEKN